MPRLYIDGTGITLKNKGVGRYSYELCRRVVDRLDDKWKIDIVVYTYEIPPNLRQNQRINVIKISKMSDLRHNLFWLPRQIHNRKYDLLLKPMESAGIKYNVPTITVCHDIQELINIAAGSHTLPHQKLIKYINRIFKSINLRNSSSVVCNSIFTKNMAALWYGFDIGKTEVGYCGVDAVFFDKAKKFNSRRIENDFNETKYILTFATGDVRENYEFLPEILQNVRNSGCQSKLVVAGIRKSADYVKTMDAKFRRLGLLAGVDYAFLDFLGEDRLDELIQLYTDADFYLELSKHEGFGMQLAEAMACGTTCISSGAGALTEVAAGYDIQFPSFDTKKIGETIVASYLKNLHQRDNKSQVEYVRTHYSWDNVAELVVDKIELLSSEIIADNI